VLVVKTKKVLLVGETWMSSATHAKGFDHFTTVTTHSGADPLLAALAGGDFEVEHMPAHASAASFPLTLEALEAYDALVLSDIGSNTLLLHPDVWLHGKPVANRLKLIAQWVQAGGGLVMAGGYFSYQGIDGKARWHKTPVEAALPVECLSYDDRLEIPEGFRAQIAVPEHPILRDIPPSWPLLLGANEVIARERPDVRVLARLPASEGGHPLLVSGACGRGRSVAWTSDIGPHWAPREFCDWPGYRKLWENILAWVTEST
jgi:uncharacterized membrane protein